MWVLKDIHEQQLRVSGRDLMRKTHDPIRSQDESWRIITDEEIDMLIKHATSSECKNWIYAESSTLLKPEGTRRLGKPHLR